MSSPPWAFSPVVQLPELHTIDIQPGEGENLRQERLVQFVRVFHMLRSNDPKYHITITGYYDQGTWTQEWVRGRRGWSYQVLRNVSRVEPGYIRLDESFNATLGGIVRVTASRFDGRLPGLSLPDHWVPPGSSGPVSAVIDPRCRPINGFSPMPRRRIELEVIGRVADTGLWETLGEKFSVELEDGVNGFEKAEAAFKPYALKIAERWMNRITDVKLSGKTVFQAEFDHMKEKQWHAEFANKVKAVLSAAIRLPGNVTAKVSADAFVKDPLKWIESGKFKGGAGVTIDFEFGP